MKKFLTNSIDLIVFEKSTMEKTPGIEMKIGPQH
jgi:hypothetical protein